MSAAAGFLHTVPALAPAFDSLTGERAPDVRRIHVADAWLLDTARRVGVTDAVQDAVVGHVRHLAGAGADAVLVTCSSIGEAAERAAQLVDVPVVRVDAPMADEAVRVADTGGGRIAVLATLDSTLGPTGRLVERAAAGRPITVTSRVVSRESVAEAIREAADGADVVVLAQASMAEAAQAAAVDVPVLTSPAGGVRALLSVLGGP